MPAHKKFFRSVKKFVRAVGSTLQAGLLNLLGVDDDAEDPSALINKQSSNAYIPVIYGQVKVGGTIIFKGISGSDNEYLHIVLVHSVGEVGQIGDVYLDDVISTDSRFTGLLSISKYTGTSGQSSDSVTDAAFSTWTTDHTLTGVAYTAIRLKYDQDKLNRQPVINVIIDGQKVLDIRDGTTAYQTNPALIIYDYLTSAVYGKGLATSALHTQSFKDAADYCETQYETYEGSGVYMDYFACNGIVDTSKTVLSNLKALLTSCRGMLTYVSGQYRLDIEKDEVPTFTFDIDNIIGGWSFSDGSKSSRYNQTKMSFINPDRNWQPDVAVTESSVHTTLIAVDNGFLSKKDLKLPFETNPHRAAYIGETVLKRSREQVRASFVSTVEALENKPGDVVWITHETPGWTLKKFRILSMTYDQSGAVSVQVVEHEPTVYDRTVLADFPTPPNTNLPDPYTVSAPTGLTLTSDGTTLIHAGDGVFDNRIKATITASTGAYVSGNEFQYKKTADSGWIPAGITTSRDDVTVYIDNVIPGVSYDVRARSFNTYGISSAWTSTVSVSAQGREGAFYWKTHFESKETHSVALFGAGSAVFDGSGITLTGSQTSATGINSAQILREPKFPVNALNWTKKRIIKARFEFSKAGTGSGSNSTTGLTVGAFSGAVDNLMGFNYRAGTLYYISGNGNDFNYTTRTAVSTPLSTDSYEVVFTPGAIDKVEFYRNGTLEVTHTEGTEYVPDSTTSTSGDDHILQIIVRGNSSTPGTDWDILKISEYEFYQAP